MKLRLIAMFMIAMFAVIGLALILVGIAIFRDVLVGGLVTFLIGCALLNYDLRLASDARRGRFPDWIRDLVGAPL